MTLDKETQMKQLISILILILLVPTAGFAIDISGNISGVWSPENNPYDLVGDASIPADQQLIINPGVIVRAMGNYRITALGTIMANATVADSISFVNGTANPAALWKGIRLENTSLASSFAHCYIENGEYGINSINSPVDITYSHFRRNTKGVHAYGIGIANPAQVLVSHCKIEYSGENGILIAQNSNTAVLFCDISNNGVASTYRGAIQLSNQSAGGSNNPTIAHNHIHHNRWQGITAWDIVGAGAINPYIHNNLIEYNLTGIYLLNASGSIWENLIRHNYIPGDMNSGAGVMVSGATSQPYFERNIITHNFTGFYITNNARPILGDLEIFHEFAQGQNVIRNNVDADGVPHSIVCASYPQSANIIKAENNYWDFNDAASILSYITDGNSNPALPIVDFEPFLLFTEPITIIGNVQYSGAASLGQMHIQIIDVESGAVLHQSLLPQNGLINLDLPVEQSFYAVVKAHLVDTEGSYLFGCAGGIHTPQSFDPEELVNIGTIQISDEMPKAYISVGNPIEENGTQLYPLKHQWFVYAPTAIDWLYRSGDYIYIVRKEIFNGSSLESYDLPPGSRFMKVANLEDGQIWQKTDVDAYGNLICSEMSVYEVFFPSMGFPFPGFSYLFVQQDPMGNIISERLYDTQQYQNVPFYHSDYLGDFPTSSYKYDLSIAQTDYSIFPLFSGNRWQSSIDEINYAAPHKFVFHWDWNYTLRFHWQAPLIVDTLWTAYRIYDNGEIIAEVPISQRQYSYTNPQLWMGYHFMWVVATDGINESAISNFAAIGPSSNDDNINPVQNVKMGPNPFSPNSVSGFEINAKFESKAETRLNIYNMRGQLVHHKSFGNESCIKYTWTGKDTQMRRCAAGVYFVEISRDRQKSLRRKIVLIH